MNNLQTFENSQFGKLNVLVIDGKEYFPATECARILGYSDPYDAVTRHTKGSVKRLVPTPGGEQEIKLISEGDLYRLIIRSNLPQAEMFERWVFDEVLPTIRKTGGYVANDDLFLRTYLPNVDEATRAMFRSTLETVRALNAKIETDRPKIVFADAVATSKTSILIGDLAKLIRQNGVEIGQKRLFEWMRDNGYLIKQKGTSWNMPTQRAMEAGWFEVKETAIAKPDGSNLVSRTVKVTGLGQTYFINKFLAGKEATA